MRCSGVTKKDCAASEGMTEKTIYTWEREDDLYRSYVAECMSEVKTDGLSEALNVLRAALRSEDSKGAPIPMHVRLRAAGIIVQSADRADSLTASVNINHEGVVTVVSRVEVPERRRNG
jgi:hypothetical protein